MTLKFSKEHEWVRVEGELVVIGISDYAQKALGDVVSLDLPKKGAVFEQSKPIGMIDSMKASSDVYAPIGGEVIEVNEELNNNPEWINQSPYEKGWLVKIKPNNLAELEGLMDEEKYNEYTKGL